MIMGFRPLSGPANGRNAMINTARRAGTGVGSDTGSVAT
jgi:hypothetical protein